MGNPLTAQPNPVQPATAHLSTSRTPTLHQVELPDVQPFRVSKGFNIAKLLLGSLDILCAIITMGLAISAITSPYVDLFHDSASSPCLALAVISMSWQIAEHITLAIRRDWRSIHPGAHVGVHLMLCILVIWVVTMLCLKLAFELKHWGTKWDSEIDFRIECTFPSLGAAISYFGIIKALVGFSVMLLILHLALFLIACIETDCRRRHGKKSKIRHRTAASSPSDGHMCLNSSNHPPQEDLRSGPAP